MKTQTSEQGEPKRRIQDEAEALGFDAIGFTKAELPNAARERLNAFVNLERHGDMDWLESRQNERSHPQSLWPEANSVIMLGVNYGPDRNPLDALRETSNGAISVYAQNKDYHDVIKKRLKRLARLIAAEYNADVKVFIDTAPVMEKPLAARAGLGWQGKHTNLVSRELGSWLFLGAIFTTLDIQPDEEAQDRCGACQSCIDICPTDAFPAPYQLDARRCISYLTIEHKGPIPHALRPSLGNRIYGCDDCLAVCPWNKFAQSAREMAFHARDDLTAPRLLELARLDDKSFREKFSGSPVKRTGRDRFVRNVLIAIGNSSDPVLIDTVTALLDDPNALVRGAAVWALSRLSPEQFNQLKKSRAVSEMDASVLLEWELENAAPAGPTSA